MDVSALLFPCKQLAEAEAKEILCGLVSTMHAMENTILV